MIRALVLAVALFAAANVQAAEANIDANGWIGGMFGLHIPDADRTDPATAFGITAGAKLGTEIGLGGYYMSSSNEQTLSTGNVDWEYSLLGIELTYQFEGEASGMYLGGRLGLTSLDAGNADFNPYHWGALVGYNHFLADTISIGGEGTFFSISKDTDEGVESKAFNIISFLATAKFWF